MGFRFVFQKRIQEHCIPLRTVQDGNGAIERDFIGTPERQDRHMAMIPGSQPTMIRD